MSVAELKRCFECGATYPSQTVACASDGTPLTFDTVGRRWKVDGVLTRRVGGAVFSAFHLIEKTRAAIDLLPGENARDATASDRLQKQLQALRLLDQHKNILRLLEDGTERDGSRFFVCELLQARPLQDVIDERQRPAVGLIDPATATATTTAVLRPLLSLLSTAARLGIAHGALDASQLYVASSDDFASGLQNLSQLKLHGLAVLGMGPALREATAADLRSLGVLLFELLTGKRLQSSDASNAAAALTEQPEVLQQLVLRAVSAPGHQPFQTAEEMQRALTGQSGAPQPLSQALSDALVMPPPPAAKLSGPMRRISLPPPPAVAAGGPLPTLRVTSQHSALPSPLAPLSVAPNQRSGLTGELRQVSILDLIQEAPQPRREETLARSRRRPSLDQIKVPSFPPPEPLDAGDSQQLVIQVGGSSQDVPEAHEPTVDARQDVAVEPSVAASSGNQEPLVPASLIANPITGISGDAEALVLSSPVAAVVPAPVGATVAEPGPSIAAAVVGPAVIAPTAPAPASPKSSPAFDAPAAAVAATSASSPAASPLAAVSPPVVSARHPAPAAASGDLPKWVWLIIVLASVALALLTALLNR